MNEDQKEDLLQALEGARNFMLGMALDPSLGSTQKDALKAKADELDGIVEEYSM